MSRFNKITKGPIWRAKRVWLKRSIISKWDRNFYSAHESDRTIKFLNNWSLAFSQFAHWHGKVQPQVICQINQSQGLRKFLLWKSNLFQSGEYILDCYIRNNGKTLHLLLAIKAGLMLFFTSERQKKTNNNNILNPLLRPPLSNKPSFSVKESFNNKPPSFLTPIPPSPLFLFFTNK